MWKLVGGALGLSTLVFTASIFLRNWGAMGLHHKILLLVVPTIFGTIGVLALMYLAQEFGGRLFRRLTHRPEPDCTNQPVRTEHTTGTFLVSVVLFSVAVGLYVMCEYLFG